MADYPDVLDHLGKTPREFGGLHLFVEPVSVDDGWGWTTLWFQAAFEPFDTTSTFTVHAVERTARVLRDAQRVPPLERGAVMKGQVRFRLPDDVQQVMVKVRSMVLDGSERCRPAWKLFDTFEIPKESEMRPAPSSGINLRATAAATLLGAPFGVAVIAFDSSSARSPSLAQTVKTTVHQAQQLPDGFVAEVVRDPKPQPPGEGFSALWVPGQALPEPPPPPARQRPVIASGAPASGRIECRRCGFEGKWTDYGSDKYCPGCGHDWK